MASYDDFVGRGDAAQSEFERLRAQTRRRLEAPIARLAADLRTCLPALQRRPTETIATAEVVSARDGFFGTKAVTRVTASAPGWVLGDLALDVEGNLWRRATWHALHSSVRGWSLDLPAWYRLAFDVVADRAVASMTPHGHYLNLDAGWGGSYSSDRVGTASLHPSGNPLQFIDPQNQYGFVLPGEAELQLAFRDTEAARNTAVTDVVFDRVQRLLG